MCAGVDESYLVAVDVEREDERLVGVVGFGGAVAGYEDNPRLRDAPLLYGSGDDEFGVGVESVFAAEEHGGGERLEVVEVAGGLVGGFGVEDVVVDGVDECKENDFILRHSGEEFVGKLSVVVEFGCGSGGVERLQEGAVGHSGDRQVALMPDEEECEGSGGEECDCGDNGYIDSGARHCVWG